MRSGCETTMAQTFQILWQRQPKSAKNTCKIDVFLLSSSRTTGLCQFLFWHSLSSHFPARCFLLAWWIICLENRWLVEVNTMNVQNNGGLCCGRAVCGPSCDRSDVPAENRTTDRGIFLNVIWAEVSCCESSGSWICYAVAGLQANTPNVPFFLGRIESVCLKYPSVTEQVCVFVYLLCVMCVGRPLA